MVTRATNETNDRRESGDDAFDEAWRSLRKTLRTLTSELRTLAGLRWERVRLASGEVAFGAVLAIWAAVFGLIATGVAARMFVHGLAGAIEALSSDLPWLGDLVAGAFVLAAGPILVLFLRSLRRRRVAERLIARYGPELGSAPVVKRPVDPSEKPVHAS